MKKNILLYIVACVSILLTGVRCTDESEAEAVLKIERDGVNFANAAGVTTLDVTTDKSDWAVAVENGQTWLTAVREGSTLKLSATESNERVIRTSYAVVTAGNRTKKLLVKQLGYEADILIEPETPADAPEEIPAEGGTVALKVTANVDLTVTIPVDWITRNDNTRALSMTETVYSYTVQPNTTDEPRSAVLTFAETGGTFFKQIEIVQAAVPPTIENLQAEPQPGAVKLSWTPRYTSSVKINYTITDPLNGNAKTSKEVTVEGNQTVIRDLRARYGEIEFSLQPFNGKGESGVVSTIKATAQTAPVQTFPERTATWIQIPEAEVLDRVWVDSYESYDGHIKYLVDGIEPVQYSVSPDYGGEELEDNYFHQMWYGAQNFPHYIVKDLGKEVKMISFYYVGRAGTGGLDPVAMDVLVSQTFVPEIKDENYGYTEHVIDAAKETSESAQLLHSYVKNDLPLNDYRGGTGGRPVRFTSEDLSLSSSTPFRYVWFKLKEVYNGSQYTALSELKVFEVKLPHTYDPETETETPLP
ncbi:MAG: hypothetical protein LBU44_02020 [Mediterranea sp.]|jgi:hypothetical protein|nr:hypothetical protein [Mediterranea sp.]